MKRLIVEKRSQWREFYQGGGLRGYQVGKFEKAHGRTLFVSRGEQVSAEEEWQEDAGELGDAGGGFV